MKKIFPKMISMKLYIFILLILLSCNNECLEGVGPDSAVIVIRLIDSKNNESSIGTYGHKYKSDAVSLKSDPDNPINYSIHNDLISITIHGSDDIEIGEIYKKNFYLLLPDSDGNPNRHSDTISFEYNYKKQECPDIWFDIFKVYYNDSLYHDGEFIDHIDFYE